MPIRARLTLITAAMMALLLVAAGGLIFWFFRAQVIAAVDAGLASRSDQIVAVLEQRPESVPLSSGVIESDEAFAQIVNTDATVVDGSPGLPASPLIPPHDFPASTSTVTLTRTVETGEEPVPSRLLVTTTDSGSVLIVGASLEDVNEQLATLARTGTIVGLLVVALTAGIGWVMAGAALRPVESMRREAEQISADDLHQRLAAPSTRDELSRLAETLNALLADVEGAFDRERAFIGQASHELRTPLANLKAEIDLALRRPRDKSELRAALASVDEEVERLTALANGLLDLARLGQGQGALTVEDVDVQALVHEVANSACARAAERGVQVEVKCSAPDGAAAIRVDSQRVRQVITNLLENAIRHSPPGGRVTLSSELHECWTLKVADQGPGFGPGQIESLAQPLSSGGWASDSAGIGLSIVKAIVEAHSGTLSISNEVKRDGVAGASVVVRI